jgi:hypothetical protein
MSAFGSTLATIALLINTPSAPTQISPWGFSNSRLMSSSRDEKHIVDGTPATQLLLLESEARPDQDLRGRILLRIQELIAQARQQDEFDRGRFGDDMIKKAEAFISIFPNDLTLPKPMLGDDGTLGFYWGFDSFFADIEFDKDGSLSLFMRDDLSKEEVFYEGLPLENKSLVNLYSALATESLGKVELLAA